MRGRIAAALAGALMLLGVGLLIPGAVSAQVSSASWAPTRCWAYSPVFGQVLGSPGFGAWFRTAYVPNTSIPVTGAIYQFHRANGAECGYLGFPIATQAHADATATNKAYYVQYFVRPYSCSLRAVVALDDGSGVTYSVELQNYYCVGA